MEPDPAGAVFCASQEDSQMVGEAFSTGTGSVGSPMGREKWRNFLILSNLMAVGLKSTSCTFRKMRVIKETNKQTTAK